MSKILNELANTLISSSEKSTNLVLSERYGAKHSYGGVFDRDILDEEGVDEIKDNFKQQPGERVLLKLDKIVWVENLSIGALTLTDKRLFYTPMYYDIPMTIKNLEISLDGINSVGHWILKYASGVILYAGDNNVKVEFASNVPFKLRKMWQALKHINKGWKYLNPTEVAKLQKSGQSTGFKLVTGALIGGAAVGGAVLLKKFFDKSRKNFIKKEQKILKEKNTMKTSEYQLITTEKLKDLYPIKSTIYENWFKKRKIEKPDVLLTLDQVIALTKAKKQDLLKVIQMMVDLLRLSYNRIYLEDFGEYRSAKYIFEYHKDISEIILRVSLKIKGVSNNFLYQTSTIFRLSDKNKISRTIGDEYLYMISLFGRRKEIHSKQEIRTIINSLPSASGSVARQVYREKQEINPPSESSMDEMIDSKNTIRL